jgi:hypothetical protein
VYEYIKSPAEVDNYCSLLINHLSDERGLELTVDSHRTIGMEDTANEQV